MQRYRIKPEIQHNFTYDIANLILTTEEWKDKGVSAHALEKASAKDVVVHLYSNSVTPKLGHHDFSGGFINIRVQFPNDTAADFDLRTENNLPEELIKHIESFFNPPKDVAVNAIPKEEGKRPFEVGDRVCCASFGNGTVGTKERNLVTVNFQQDTTNCYFDDGRAYFQSIAPTLRHGHNSWPHIAALQ
jgi:hypothetical protein